MATHVYVFFGTMRHTAPWLANTSLAARLLSVCRLEYIYIMIIMGVRIIIHRSSNNYYYYPTCTDIYSENESFVENALMATMV